MATDKPRFTITLPDDVFDQVAQYKTENKISTQSKAIQKLIGIGLESIKEPEQTQRAPSLDGLDAEDVEVARDFHALDAPGKKVVRLVIGAEAERIGAAVPAAVVVDLGMIRHYLYRPAAGPDGMVSGSDYEDIPRTPDMPKNASYCLTVSGDSMEPYIKDGQMVYVEEDVPLGDMEVGVFFYQGGIYVKQYAPSFDGGVFLLSANPAREAANITVPRESVQDLYYMGKVILKKKLPPPIYR